MANGSTRQFVHWRAGKLVAARCAVSRPGLPPCLSPPSRRAHGPVSTVTTSAAAAQREHCIPASTVSSVAPRPPVHRVGRESARSRAIAMAPVPAPAGVVVRPATGATTAQPAALAGVAISGLAPEDRWRTRRTVLAKEPFRWIRNDSTHSPSASAGDAPAVK